MKKLLAWLPRVASALHMTRIGGFWTCLEMWSDLKEIVEEYKSVYVQIRGEEFPSDPYKQLELAVTAVFFKYRSINQITGFKGTAVNIQCMVFGNMGNTSRMGVLFTRNPSIAEKKLYGEFLINAHC